MVAVDIGELWVVSCSFSPNSGMAAFTKFVSDLEVLVASINNKLLLVAGYINV